MKKSVLNRAKIKEPSSLLGGVFLLSQDPACSAATAFATVLRDSGLSDVTCIQDVAQAGAGPVIVLYDDAVHAITRAISAGCTLETALVAWLSQAEPIAAFCNQASQRTALLERQALLAHPRSAISWACMHLGLPMPVENIDIALNSPADLPDSMDDILLLIAAQAVGQSEQARQLMHTLRELALPISGKRDFGLSLDMLEAARDVAMTMRNFPTEQTALREKLAHVTAALAEAESASAEAVSKAEIKTLHLHALQDALEAR